MDVQQKERQASAPAVSSQTSNQAKPDDRKAALKGLSYDEQVQMLSPNGAAGQGGAGGPAKPGNAVDDDGGPGATVTRFENDPRYGKPPAAVKVKVPDQQVDENQTASVKADVVDPDAPGQTNQLWFNWAQSGGPAYTKATGQYGQTLSFQAPEVDKNDVLTGEVSVSKRGFIKPRSVETKKPFAVKVREVPKPETKEEAAPPAPVPAAVAQTPVEAAPGKPRVPDMAMIEALLAMAMSAGKTPKAAEPEAPAQSEQPEAPAKTESPEPPATTPVATAPAPKEEGAPAATPHHHARHRHHRRHFKHRHHHAAKHPHAGHAHKKHNPHAKHRHPHRHGADLFGLMAELFRAMNDVVAGQHQHALPHSHAPKPKPPVKRPTWLPPKAPPKVTAPAAKTLQAGERGLLNTAVVDPDQGKLGGPKIEWRQDAAAQKLEDIKGQGTSQIEFKAPQVSKKVTLTGIVHATDADGLNGQAPFAVTVEPAVAANETGKVWGDPHFVGGDGDKYDIMGKNGGVYNLHSDTGVRVTGLFKTYNREGITVVDKVGTIVTGKGLKGVSSNQIEYSPTVATIDGKALAKNKSTPLADGGSALLLANRLVIDTREGYKVTIYSRQSGAVKYCDVDVQTGARGVGSGADPDGLLGQTFDADKTAKKGKTGAGAQGEGAIAGVVTDYETNGLFGAGKGKHAQGGLDAATDERRLFRKTVLVPANPGLGADGFVETDVDVAPGDNVIIAASGAAGEAKKLTRNPAGDPRYTHPQKANFMAPAAPAFSLVGRVSGEKTGFAVGAAFKGGVKKGGKLQLAFNDLRGTFADNVGEYIADVQVVKGLA
ncbi:MAG: hypothetical protein JNJ59_03360 [Deltaproteobacteria bacterium]|nr:hypothetical protein [Deltaproteobacteria bacterium]